MSEILMWYVILDDEIRFAQGEKREQGYWWFPQLGYAIHEKNIFESNIDAENELLKRLMIQEAELVFKINKLKSKVKE